MSANEGHTKSYVDNVTPLITSALASLFAVQNLYNIANQKELWIAVFAVLDVIVYCVKRLVTRLLYSEEEKDDIDNQTLLKFLRFIHMTIVFIVMKLVFDIFSFLMGTNVMYWYNYIEVFALLMTILFVIMSKLE